MDEIIFTVCNIFFLVIVLYCIKSIKIEKSHSNDLIKIIKVQKKVIDYNNKEIDDLHKYIKHSIVNEMEERSSRHN